MERNDRYERGNGGSIETELPDHVSGSSVSILPPFPRSYRSLRSMFAYPTRYPGKVLKIDSGNCFQTSYDSVPPGRSSAVPCSPGATASRSRTRRFPSGSKAPPSSFCYRSAIQRRLAPPLCSRVVAPVGRSSRSLSPRRLAPPRAPHGSLRSRLPAVAAHPYGGLPSVGLPLAVRHLRGLTGSATLRLAPLGCLARLLDALAVP